MKMKKRVQSHVLEKIIALLMFLFGASAIYVFYIAKFRTDTISSINLAIIEILLILGIVILSQTLILIKIYEQHL